MLLSLANLVNERDLKINGILHVGAHLAEEAKQYEALGIDNVWWIEGNKDNIPAIIDEVGSPKQVIWALVTDEDDQEVVFHITNYDSMSSSILEFGTHPTFSPETVFVEHRTMKTSTIDSLVRDNSISGVNFLNMDLQGAEMLALKGSTNLIPQLDYIYSEVNCKEVYKNCVQVGDLDSFLQDRGFLRVETGWVDNQGWGDALYVRRELV